MAKANKASENRPDEMNSQPAVDVRIDTKAAEIMASITALLADCYTRNDLERALLFEAAWARLQMEDALRIAKALHQESRKLLTLLDVLRSHLKEIEGEHAAWVREASASTKEIYDLGARAMQLALPLANRGASFTGNKRGRSDLYSAALQITKELGDAASAKRVYNRLEACGKIQDGKPTLKAFSTQLSRLRQKSR